MPTMPPVRNAMWKPRFDAATTGGRRDADVGPGRQRHADVADRGGEDRADDEEERPADLDAVSPPWLTGSRSSSTKTITEKTAERAELTVQVGRGAFLDGLGDLLHLRGALSAASTSRTRTTEDEREHGQARMTKTNAR